jgi:hypothetical protein
MNVADPAEKEPSTRPRINISFIKTLISKIGDGFPKNTLIIAGVKPSSQTLWGTDE